MAAVTSMPYKPPGYLSERDRIPASDYLLDWYLKVRREGSDWEVPVEKRGWRASSLGDCPRAQTLTRRGLDPLRVFDAKTLRTFAWGDFIHDWVKTMYRDLHLTVAEEPTLTDPARSISGHADLLFTVNPLASIRDLEHPDAQLPKRLAAELTPLWGRDDGTAVRTTDGNVTHIAPSLPTDVHGMELKSVHSNAIKRVFNEGPYEHHTYQVGSYKLMSQSTGTVDALFGGVVDMKEVERWFITYVGKDSVGLLTFECEDSWVDNTVGRLDLLNRSWAAGVLPVCACKGWQVQYCAYNEGDTCCGRNTRGRVARALRKKGL